MKQSVHNAVLGTSLATIVLAVLIPSNIVSGHDDIGELPEIEPLRSEAIVASDLVSVRNQSVYTEGYQEVNAATMVFGGVPEPVLPEEIGVIEETYVVPATVISSGELVVEIESGIIEKPEEPEIPDWFDASQSNVPNYIEGCKSYNITWMDYKKVTSKQSRQYKLLNSDHASTDPETGIRLVDGRYCIALGSGYTHEIGRYVDLVFEDGTILECILGDAKADEHTDETHRYHSVDGSVAEFVVDDAVFTGSKMYKGLYGGQKIVNVIVLDEAVDENVFG